MVYGTFCIVFIFSHFSEKSSKSAYQDIAWSYEGKRMKNKGVQEGF